MDSSDEPSFEGCFTGKKKKKRSVPRVQAKRNFHKNVGACYLQTKSEMVWGKQMWQNVKGQ